MDSLAVIVRPIGVILYVPGISVNPKPNSAIGKLQLESESGDLADEHADEVIARRHTVRSVLRRILTILLITWIPMCILAIAQGNAIASTPRGSFLLDFATYARFFIAAPLLIVAERVIGPRMDDAIHRFTSDGLVRQQDRATYEEAVKRLARRRASRWATVVLVALALFGSWNFTIEHVQGVDVSSWQAVSIGAHTLRQSLAGTWNHLVAVPLFLFLFYRWLWRLFVWTLFLRSTAQLNLELIPAHADGAGGLEFLQRTQSAFGLIAFGMTSVISAGVAFRVVYEGAKLTPYEGPLLVVVVIVELLFLGPLLVFAPVMGRARRRGMRAYGALVGRYDREFQRKWIDGGAPGNAVLLGSPDIQSLADMGNSFEFVRRMRLTPVGRGGVIRLLLATVLPTIPVLLLNMPISQILGMLKKLIF